MKFVLGRDLRLQEEPSCPVCKHLLDGVTPINFEGKPKIGDFSTYVYCGAVLRFDLGLRLKEADKDDLEELHDKQPDTFEALQRIAAAAKAAVMRRRLRKHQQN